MFSDNLAYQKQLEVGYLNGAIEQRMLDIDKAFEWFKGFLQEIGYEDCDFGYDDTDELLIELRKAMEE